MNQAPGSLSDFAPSRMEDDLCQFLCTCKEALVLDTELTIVVGNESGDLDSVCCAIALALQLSEHLGKLHIPVVNVNKDIVAMRGEVVYVLGIFGLALSDLIFIDDVSHLLRTRTLNVFLVDHNETCLAWDRQGFKHNIVGIVDHHTDAGQHLAIEPRIIEPTSSCASLLATKLDICHPLLWYPLVWDTMNITYRMTSIDFQAAGRLQSIVKLNGADTWRELERASASLPECNIPLNLLLLKDFKLFKNTGEYYGISTIHIPLNALDLEELNAAISKVMQMEDLHYFIICTGYPSIEQQDTENGYKFRLQVLIYHPLHRQVADFLNEFGQLQLKLLVESTQFSIWQQGDLTKGRKQLQPILARFLSSR